MELQQLLTVFENSGQTSPVQWHFIQAHGCLLQKVGLMLHVEAPMMTVCLLYTFLLFAFLCSLSWLFAYLVCFNACPFIMFWSTAFFGVPSLFSYFLGCPLLFPIACMQPEGVESASWVKTQSAQGKPLGQLQAIHKPFCKLQGSRIMNC